MREGGKDKGREKMKMKVRIKTFYTKILDLGKKSIGKNKLVKINPEHPYEFFFYQYRKSIHCKAKCFAICNIGPSERRQLISSTFGVEGRCMQRVFYGTNCL